MTVDQMLGRVPMFAQLTPDVVKELSRRLRLQHYEKGEKVYSAGGPAVSLCIVRVGRVKLARESRQGREIVVDLLGPGDVFGELAVLDAKPEPPDAITTEPSELLLLTHEEFTRLLQEQPAVATEMLETLNRGMQRDANAVADAAFLDVPARLARTILRLAEEAATDGPAKTPRLSQSHLAGLVGTTRETLNKWLGVFQDQGLIRLDHGRITVLERERLQQRVV